MSHVHEANTAVTEAPISASADAPTSASDVAAGSAAAAAVCFLRFLPLPSLASAPEAGRCGWPVLALPS